jgi:hypothetical protein
VLLALALPVASCGNDDTTSPQNQAPTIQLTAPSGGIAVAPGSALDITWTASDADGQVTGVTLSYTADGVTETTIAADQTVSTYSWRVPSRSLYGVRVKATVTDDAGATARDSSEDLFAIVSASARGYVTASTCQDCHSAEYTEVFNTGHPYKLNQVVGGVSPTIPNSPGVPNPPTGFTWGDVTYMIGGYGWKARFMDSDGYIITDGFNGVNAQYNLPRSDLGGGLPAEWVSYDGSRTSAKPYTCGSCHTTGWQTLADNGGVNQDGLVGIEGTWEEPGVRCESCHGPGVDHVVSQLATDITVDESAELCGSCHFRDASNRPEVSGGFIRHHEQFDELVTGGMSTLECGSCHDPHKGVRYGAAAAGGITTTCESCHAAEAATNNHVVSVDCATCHMGRASKSARAVNTFQGDIRSHLFTINPAALPPVNRMSSDLVSLVPIQLGQARKAWTGYRGGRSVIPVAEFGDRLERH